MLTSLSQSDLMPAALVDQHGDIFARFDGRTQDSGNIAFGVATPGGRYFVKTAGDPAQPKPCCGFDERVARLRNAARVADSCRHPCLPALRNVIETAAGPALVYDWVDGEPIGVPANCRDDPTSAFQRFRALPLAALVSSIDAVIAVHCLLEEAGWVAGDFYDGSMIYDFDAESLAIVDLDHYHRGPYVNDRGRMFGSRRFMAPEEFELGQTIDTRTTTFMLGRVMSVFLSDGTLQRVPFRGTERLFSIMRRACSMSPDNRFQRVRDLADDWRMAVCPAPMPGGSRSIDHS